MTVMSSSIKFNSSTSSAREGMTQPEEQGLLASGRAPMVACIGVSSGITGAGLQKQLFSAMNAEFVTTAALASAAATAVVAADLQGQPCSAERKQK